MITNNTNNTTLSSSFTDAIDSSMLSTNLRVYIDWLDSRHLEVSGSSVTVTTNDQHTSTAKGDAGHFFSPEQTVNGWERQSYLWGVCGALGVDGRTIRCDGQWHVMPDEDSSRHEFGWWSKTASDSSTGDWTTSPNVELSFDATRCTHIRVNTSEYYGQLSSIKVEYKLEGETSWTVHESSASIASGSYYYESEINNGNYLSIIGIKITALSTRNKGDFARINEIIPIYREDISQYVVDSSVDKVHTLHGSSLPIGSTASNSGQVLLDNTSGRFSPFSSSGMGPYMKKDIKITIDFGVLTDEVSDTYEYVPFGTYWIDQWSVSHNMTVDASFRDYTKFLSEIIIDDGYFTQDTLAGVAVGELVLKSNFSRANLNIIKHFKDEVIEKSGIVHLQFDDGNPGNNNAAINIADNGVWGQWWNKEQIILGEPQITKELRPDFLQIEVGALRDTVKEIDRASAPLVREIVSSSADALNINNLNNGSSDVFAGANAFDGNTRYINATFNTYYVPASSSSTLFKFTVQNAGIRVWINDNLVLDKYNNVDTPYNTDCSYVVDVGSLRANAAYKVHIEYYHWYGTQKLVWEYSTDSGSNYADVPYSSTWLAIAEDSIGIRDTYVSSAYSDSYDHFNHGVYLNSSSPVSLSQPSGMTSDASGRSTDFNNDLNSNYQHVKIPYDASLNTALSTSDNYTGSYSMEVFARFDSAIGGKGVYAGNIDDAHSASKGWGLFHTSATSGVYLYDGSSLLTASCGDTFHDTNEWTHIVATYDGTTLSYYVNGVLKGSATGSGHTSWASSDILIGKSTDSSSGSSVDYYFDGKFDEFVMYNKALTADEVLNNYYSIKIKETPYYEYLFGNSASIFDLMQEIATADLGMFAFDEYNKFNYYHYNRFYESFINEHSSVQKTISDDNFVISGSVPIDLQANKVVVKISDPQVAAVGAQQLWRAPSPTTMVITQLSGAMGTASTSIPVVSTEGEYPWYDSGYVKINNEIIQYTSKTTDSLDGLTRGMFGTTAASHSSGDKVREAKYFSINYGKAPALGVKRPFIAAEKFESPSLLYLDVWEPSAFGAEIVVSATTDNAVGDLVYMEGTDEAKQIDYFTSVAGVPVGVSTSSSQIVEQSAENSPSIRKYGVKSLEISNKFITDSAWGHTIASFIRDKFEDVVMVLSVNITGVPQLQLGDRIKIGTYDNLSISNKEFWIIKIGSNMGTGIQQTLTLREAT